MNKRFVIIDGNSLLNRAFYAIMKPMITKEGFHTKGIYGFINMLNKLLEDYPPQYIAVAWDEKHPTFRHEQFAEYKGTRKKTPAELLMEFPMMKEILDAMNITNISMAGYEADDLIGTLARLGEEEGVEPLIITGDKDALQLATNKTKILFTKKGISQYDIYDYDKMLEVYNMTPTQFIDLKGLMGDKSDNIPGIQGIGPKTGEKLIRDFGSVNGIIENLENIANTKLREKIRDNAQLAILSRKLAEINRYAPIDFNLEDYKFAEPDYPRLIDIYSKLEFNTFIKKLSKEHQENETFKEVTLEEIPLINIKTLEELKLLDEIDISNEVYLKVDSDKNHIGSPTIYQVTLMAGNKAYSIKSEKYVTSLLDQVSDEPVLEKFIDYLNNKGFTFCGHNLIEDYYPLMFHGLKNFTTGFDTSIGYYLLDSSKADFNLANTVLELFKVSLADELSSVEYCQWCEQIHKVCKSKIKDEHMEEVLKNAELPLVKILSKMEVEGFTINTEVLSKMGLDLKGELDRLSNQIYDLTDCTFNINSPKQLGEVLFEKLNLTVIKKTKTGYSTNAEVLEKLVDEHPVVSLILEYRTLNKILGTYVEGFIPLETFDHKIRAHFIQSGAATGRISCVQPNLQNIPVRDQYGKMTRKAFVPSSDEYILLSADYSQIELRVLAELSKDENLLDAFNKGEDIHRATASKVLNIPYDEVTSDERSRAKAVNFGVIYGMSPYGLSQEINCSMAEAKNYIDNYFANHQGVKNYMDSQLNFCMEHGYTKTLLGRKRYIHEINASNKIVRQLGERLAMNSPIQGTAADIIKLAMIKVSKALEEKNFRSKLILQVHDELIIDCHKEELDEISKLLKENMENAIQLSVPLVVDINQGDNWYNLK